MDEVPFEIFAKIFRYLGLDDKTRCKRVSKQWKCKINLLNIRCLTITNNFKPYFHHLKWFDRDPPQFIDYQNYVLEEDFESSFIRSTTQMLRNLKDLILCHLKLSIINRALYIFSGQIERLMIDGIICDTFADSSDLGGPEGQLFIFSRTIRVLSLAEFTVDKIVLILPELKFVEIDNLTEAEFDVHYPLSIEHAEFDYYEACLEEFENLKIVKFDSIDDEGDSLSENFLRYKPDIEEIHFGDKSVFRELKKQREEFGLTKLKLFYLGLDVTNSTNLAQFDDCHDELNEARLKLYIENSSKMADRLPFEMEIDFSEVEPVYSLLPSGFWKKLVYLDLIRITKRLNDESSLIECLKLVNVFGSLEIHVNCVTEELLKTVSVLNPTLLSLTLKSETASGYSEEGLKTIISNLAFLTELEFEFTTSLEFVQHAFEDRKFLISFTFLYKDFKYRIDEICTENDEFAYPMEENEVKEYRLYKDESSMGSGTMSELIERICKKRFGFLPFV